ncbi:CARDB domain-containing protein, partial [Kaarinaea lacus]
KFINVLKRNGKLVRRNNVSNLKAGANKEHKFLLALSSGENTLELLLDNSDSVKESSEKNNKVAVNLNIVGKCSGKQRPAKK